MSTLRTTTGAVDDLVIVRQVDLPLPVASSFALFSSATALASWLCRQADVEPCVGGRYALYWDPADPENDSTIGCRVTALDEPRLIAFQWRSPRQFKPFANDADPLTHVVVTFHDLAGATRVTLLHSGWRSSPEWRQAAAWQAVAWDHAMRALVARAAQA